MDPPIVKTALDEMARWRGREETTVYGREKVAQYWEDGVGLEQGYPSDKVAWSGAFVAWAAHVSAPGSLARSGMHSVYARLAINQRDPSKYSAYPVHVIREPRPGDIIIKARPGEVRSFIELHSDEPIKSHGDIVVKVMPDHVVAIGGNKTGNTVTSERYPRAADGTVLGGVFAVLRRGTAPEYYAAIDGWRRARESEVSEEARRDAQIAVRRLALGETLQGEDYLIAVETHRDEVRGPHRGASVFVPDERIA